MSERYFTERTCDACGCRATTEPVGSAPEWLAIYGDGTRIDICVKCAPTIRKALLTAGVSESKIPAPSTAHPIGL
jgi:hypothetical protein